jgi:hypothetical protein
MPPGNPPAAFVRVIVNELFVDSNNAPPMRVPVPAFNFPVEKIIVPRLNPVKPLMAMREASRCKPRLLPVSWPFTVVKSLVSARTADGKANINKRTGASRFITTSTRKSGQRSL